MSTSPRNIDDAGSSADLPDAFQHGNGPNNTETPEDTTLDEEQREFQQFRAWRNEQRKRMAAETASKAKLLNTPGDDKNEPEAFSTPDDRLQQHFQELMHGFEAAEATASTKTELASMMQFMMAKMNNQDKTNQLLTDILGKRNNIDSDIQRINKAIALDFEETSSKFDGKMPASTPGTLKGPLLH